MSGRLPQGLISYGPNANCTLDTCKVEWSVLRYRPSVAASAVFLALYGLAMFFHIFQGVRYRAWWYMGCMILGCLSEIVGYVGRLMYHANPFSFTAFMMQIVTITFAPVFYCAAIYVLLAMTIKKLDVSLSRFNPNIFSWAFISCDLVSLVLQAVGGSMSSNSAGSSQVGVNIALAGLSFQVATLTIFCSLTADYAFRFYRKNHKEATWSTVIDKKFKIFAGFTSAAIVLILVRCIYRIDELSEGYSGPLIANQGLFIALEGVMIVLAVYSLNIGHPGPVFYSRKAAVVEPEKNVFSASDSEAPEVLKATV